MNHTSEILGKYYQALRTRFSNPEESLYALWQKEDGIDYTLLSSLLDKDLILQQQQVNNEQKNQPPENYEAILKNYKIQLSTKTMSPLYSLIVRHGERLFQGVLNSSDLLAELRFIVQENLTERCSPFNLINFWFKTKTIFQDNPLILNEYNSLILSIPDQELHWLFKLEQYFLRINDKNRPNCPHYSLPIEGAFLKKRVFCLTQDEKSFLFDTQGLLKKYPLLPGRSRVSYYPPDNPEFYLKAFPEFPGYEYASTSFMRLLGISHLPYQDLLIVKNSEAAGYYPLLLSENVKGTTVLQAWSNNEAFNNLDPSHTFLLILSAMLLNPEDGKEDNFILSEDQKYLIPIDNDHCFLPGTVQKQGKFWNIITPSTTLQIKTLLFCLDEMQKPIPAFVKAHYLALNIDDLMKAWMEKLVDIQERYESLVDPELLPKLFEQGTVLRIPFNKSFIENMYWKAHKIQEIFRIGTDLTPFDLLRALEPYVAKHYQDAFKKSNSVKERFKTATEELYTKKMQNNDRMSILNTKAMIKIVNVPLEEISYESMLCKNGPVSTFEYIKELCATRINNIVQNKYDILEISGQRGQHIWADLSNQIHKVEKLKQFFRKPREGLILKDGDLLINSNLKDYLKMASDQSAKIRFLTLLNSTSLSQNEINLLIKGCPNLEYLNISKSSSLDQIIIKKGDWLSLTRLEARKCPKLQAIIINSPVQVLRVGSSSKLKISMQQVDPDILEISLKPKTVLHFDKPEGFSLQKSASQQKLCLVDALMNKTSFDEYSLKNLQLVIMNKTFFSFGSELEPSLWYNLSLKLLKQEDDLNIPEIFKAYYFQLPNFSKVNLSGVLFSQNTQDLLTHLNTPHWRDLQSLNLSNNNLSLQSFQGLFQDPWPNLEDLDISCNLLTKKDLFSLYLESNWPKLKTIFLAGNNIDPLQVPEFTALFLNRLQVTSLNLENIDLGDLPIQGKTYTKLDWINIKTLNLSNNNLSPKQLIEIPFQAWPNLQCLSLAHNKILDIGLDELCEATWNRLVHLDLSNNGLSYKTIKKLTAQKMPKLQYLDLSFNHISVRDIPHIFDANFPHLTEILLESTLVTHKELIKLYSQRIYPTIAVSEIIKGGPGSPALRYLDHTNELLLVPEFGLEAEWEDLEDSTQLLTLSLLEKSNTGQSSSGSRKVTEIQELSALMFENSLSQEEMKTLKMLNMAGWFIMKTMGQGEGMNKSQKGMEFIIEKLSTLKMPRFTLKKSSQEKSSNQILDNIFVLGKWTKLEKPLLRYEILIIDQATYMFCHVKSNDNSTTVSSGFSLSDSLSSSEGIIKKRISNDLGYDGLPWEIQGFRLENFSIMETKMLSFFSQGNTLEDSLECLNLSNNIIGAEGVKILTCKCWPFLKRVYLRNISATEKELEKLVKKSNWPSLRYLDLSRNNVVKAEFGMLAHGRWPSLEGLILDQFSVSGELFEKFMKDGANWPNLREFPLDIYYSMPAPEDIHIVGEIIKKWPKIKKKNVRVVEQTEKNIVSVKFVYHHN